MIGTGDKFQFSKICGLVCSYSNSYEVSLNPTFAIMINTFFPFQHVSSN